MIKVNGEPIKIDRFPNGELNIDTQILNKIPKNSTVSVEFKWANNEDILSLWFVLQHLQDNSITNYELYIYYLPYSRMDRNQNGNCFTLKHLCYLLGFFNVKMYKIVEPHSDVSLGLLAPSERINFITPLMGHILRLNPDINMICYPDKGAKNRFQDDSVTLPVVYCSKVRDFDTGEIKGLELEGDVNVSGKNILILDDLCSRGGTFYHTANKLKENGANDVYLGVCHMELTVEYGWIVNRYNKENNSPIKHIYCSDSMLICKLPEISNITIYSMEEFLNNGNLKEVNRYE